MFLSAEDHAACGVTMALSRKQRAKLCHCLSDELSSRKQFSGDFRFKLLDYYSVHSLHISPYEDEIEQRNLKAEETNAEPLSRADNGESDFALRRAKDVSKVILPATPCKISSLNQKLSKTFTAPSARSCNTGSPRAHGLFCAISYMF